MIARSGHDQKWNFFATLGLMPPCTVEDVKQAYLAKATKAHPDTGGDVESFKQLQEAYKQGTEYARSHSILTSWFKSSIKRYVHREHLVDELRRLGGRVDIKKSECSRQEVVEDFAQIFDKLVGIHLH